MTAIAPYKNVFLDTNAQYEWHQLTETDYLDEFFKCLKEKLGIAFETYSFYVFSAHTIDSAIPASKGIPGDKKILFFFSDEHGSYTPELNDHYLLIFKSSMKATSYYPKNDTLYPFPIGYVTGVKQIDQKKYSERSVNVFYSGNLSNPRIPIFKNLLGLAYIPDWVFKSFFYFFKQQTVNFLGRDFSNYFPNSYIKFTTGYGKGLSKQEYAEMLGNAKIVLCPKGFINNETFRMYEGLRCGCIIITEKLPDHEFYVNAPVYEVKDWKEGIILVKKLLAKPIDELEALRIKMIKGWAENMSEAALSEYVVEKIHLKEKNQDNASIQSVC